jgi:hypothetical protein
MSVRAKFKVHSITSTLTRVNQAGQTVEKELQTINLSPVYDNDPESENGKFYAYTPAGKIELGTVNADAAKDFELGKEMYVTFEPAE